MDLRDQIKQQLKDNATYCCDGNYIYENLDEFKKLSNRLGFTEFDISDQEAFNANVGPLITRFFNQTKGAISNREMQLFIDASPTLGSTYDGYMKQLELLERLASRDSDFYKAYLQKQKDLNNVYLTTFKSPKNSSS